jgi:hypothetical protein
VTDGRCNAEFGYSMAEAVNLAILGGATMVQLREKDVDGGPFLATAEKVLQVARPKKVGTQRAPPPACTFSGYLQIPVLWFAGRHHLHMHWRDRRTLSWVECGPMSWALLSILRPPVFSALLFQGLRTLT